GAGGAPANPPIAGDVRSEKYVTAAHHPGTYRLCRRFKWRLEPVGGHLPRLSPTVVGQHEPAGDGNPRGQARYESLRDALRLEARIDRADHVGEDIGPRKPPLERRLKRPEPARQVPAH